MEGNPKNLDEEGERITKLLVGKTISYVRRHRDCELLIEFADGTRLFVDAPSEALELSITGDFQSD